jgi:hypothetical protein
LRPSHRDHQLQGAYNPPQNSSMNPPLHSAFPSHAHGASLTYSRCEK